MEAGREPRVGGEVAVYCVEQLLPMVNPDEIQLRSAMLEFVAALGVEVGRLVAASAGASTEQFEAPEASTAPEDRALSARREFYALWHALEAVAADIPDVGLRFGAETQSHQLDVLYAAIHAPNLGTALKNFARYKPSGCGDLVEIDIGDHEARIDLHRLYADENVPTTLVDSTFAAVLALARRGTGKTLRPLRVELARRRAGDAILKDHYKCDVCFNAPVDSLIFEEQAFALPFVTADDRLSARLLTRLEAMLQARQWSHSIADDAKHVLRRHMLGERPSVDRVAANMHMSPRTLQRRLTALGTSYQKLLNDVRDNMARRLLLDTDLDAGEIAILLGFDEPSSFVRAFHAWQGAPPSRWREDQIDHRGVLARSEYLVSAR
jgi:AraC-like DNA-binding protein